MRTPSPRCQRRIGFLRGATYFKPTGIPLRTLEEVIVTLDEIEALRLADLERCDQKGAAEPMRIWRPTFERTVEPARRKVADALGSGKVLHIEGGPVASLPSVRPVFCSDGCGWRLGECHRGGPGTFSPRRIAGAVR